jgi:hypothetical protein
MGKEGAWTSEKAELFVPVNAIAFTTTFWEPEFVTLKFWVFGVPTTTFPN